MQMMSLRGSHGFFLNMLGILLLCGSILCPGMVSADALIEEQFEKAEMALQRGIELYRDSDFDLAIFELKEAASLLDNQIEELTQRKKLIDANLYLGLAYIGIGSTARAKEQFSVVVHLDNSYTLAPDSYSSKVVLLFNEARAETLARLIEEKRETDERQMAVSRRSSRSSSESSEGLPSEDSGKRWYKKWWVWGLAGVAVVGIAAAASGASTEEDEANKPPSIGSITLDPNLGEYSIVHIIKISCDVNDDQDSPLEFQWQCANGEFENSMKNFESTTDKSVKWSYTQYSPDSSHRLQVPRHTEPRRGLSFSHGMMGGLLSDNVEIRSPRIVERQDRGVSRRVSKASRQRSKSPTRWPLLSTQSLLSSIHAKSAREVDEFVDISVRVIDNFGLEDKRTISIPIKYTVPVDRIGFIQGAVQPGRDTRLKTILISVDATQHFGPFDIQDTGYNNTSEIRISFAQVDMRQSIVISILDVYSDSSGNSGLRAKTESSLQQIQEIIEFRLYSSLLAGGEYSFARELTAYASSFIESYPPYFFNDDDMVTFWACDEPTNQQFGLYN